MHGSSGVAHLADRHPTVTPERLVAQLIPPPTFADVSYDSYRPDPAEPSQAAAVESCRKFCEQAAIRRAGKKKLFGKREVLPGVGLYLDGGFGVGKTHLLASTYYTLSQGDAPTAFATFGELTQLAGVFGYNECIDLLSEYSVVCIDEFELDDPGNTTLISRLLSALVERGVSIAATSNTLPEQLGEGRFAAQDFLREINTLAQIFTTVRIEGPDYRHRDLPPAPEPLSDDEVAQRAEGVVGATLDDFDVLCAHLATMHPSRYHALIEDVTEVFITGVHPIEDQSVALRLVALTDRLYDAGIPVLASGTKLDTIFSPEMVAGGFRKKYLRATSRLLALTAAAQRTA
ncbi:cell division protein ZapE [Mycolicibacterium peregrinum]|uniref:Cell division protein ZapE n=1 Tax=Mycolicibacterium peregrinum TaxID=43304 RepID=A0A1X2BCT8_MYCPR|nr:cell division protein ZapE [Mycolicibacterium peregrinum]MCV7201937.1 cell division protein ZapE [Mycolicibacterium peregrinum]ORW61402.1 ATPase [Mycolicibacterium peregrinum]OWM12723.1 cell division protein ZapE [Mycolicibacterium peregrinum]TGB37294.1 cell division protein ZapE [Mycolicibacterium peregrinum]TGB42775.1 cell division protein ZapE [Mycolicibacterium peregrinum]